MEEQVLFQRIFKQADDVSGLNRPLPMVQRDTSAFDAAPVPLLDDNTDSNGRDPRIRLPSSELEQLRRASAGMIVVPHSNVHRQGDENSSILGRYSIEEKQEMERRRARIAQLDLKVVAAPERPWEREVSLAMQDDSSTASDENTSGEEQELVKCTSDRQQAADEIAFGPGSSRINGDELLTGNDRGLMFRPQRRVDFDIAPYQCFDTEFVDVEERRDPLDVLIPNVVGETNYALIMQRRKKRGFSESKHLEATSNVQFGAYDVSDVGAMQTDPPTAAEGESSTSLKMQLVISESRADQIKRQLETRKKRLQGLGLGLLGISASITEARNSIDMTTSQSRSSRSSRSVHNSLSHSLIATLHKNTKPDLFEIDLKHFHRPRMVKERDRAWHVNLKQAGSSKKSATEAVVRRILLSDNDKRNLSLTDSDTNFVMIEYMEEFPPMALNFGMASALLNCYRAPDGEDEDESRATKRMKEDSNRAVDRVLNSSRCCRLPRHLMLLLHMRNSKKSYEHDVNIPRLRIGDTKVLHKGDQSPFLGEIDEGEIQQSLANNLFRAPIFKHKAHPTDFLLIRTRIDQNQLNYVIREIPYLFVCGQQEPLKAVPRPVFRINQLQEKFYTLAAVRLLQTRLTDGVDWNEIQRTLLKYCLKEKVTPHKNQHRLKLRDIVKKVGEESRRSMTGSKWYPKNFADKANSEEELAEMERRFSPEELAKGFSPEDVCLQESCNAAEYRLFQEHITDVELPKVEAWLTHMTETKKWHLNRLKSLERILSRLTQQQDSMLKLVDESNDTGVLTARDAKLRTGIEQMIRILRRLIKHIDALLKVGQFLFSRLVTAPWNTSEAYVRSQLERDVTGRIDLDGMGRIADPSGRCEGFSLIRINKLQAHTGGAAAPSSAKSRNPQHASNDGHDLRKVKAQDLIKLLVAMGMSDKEARAVPSRDRISLIKQIATEFKRKGKAPQFHKYARQNTAPADRGDDGAVITTEQFQQTAQQIWLRQKAALSSTQLHSAASAEGKMLRDRLQLEVNESDDEDEAFDIAENIQKIWESRNAANGGNTAKQPSSSHIEESKRNNEDLTYLRNFLGTGPDHKKDIAAPTLKKRRIRIDAGHTVADPSTDMLQSSFNTRKAVDGAGDRPADQQATDGEQAAPLATAIYPSADGSSTDVLTGSTSAAHVPNFKRPSRVLKRVTRITKSDGSESIKIEFILSQSEVDRVLRSADRLKEERETRRASTAVGGLTVQDVTKDDADVAATHTANASMSIRFGQMKRTVEQEKALQKKQREQLAADPYMMKKSKGTKSSRRNVASAVSQRVPRISFAVRLEKELMDLWNMKGAAVFRDPVSPTEVPHYYMKISNPICLSEIRDKIASCKYETAAQFEADLQLMAMNAETFNGANHPIAITGRKMVENLRMSLLNERKNLGEANDPILFMEDAIHRQKTVLKKTLQGSGALSSDLS